MLSKWLDDERLEHTTLNPPPPSSEFGVHVGTSGVVILGHENSGIVEIQHTYSFDGEWTARFFELGGQLDDGIKDEVSTLLISLDIRHQIISNKRENFFGISMYFLLEKDTSMTDFFNKYYKILEAKRLVSIRVKKLLNRELQASQ